MRTESQHDRRVREREHGKAEGTRALSETDLGEDSFVSSHLLHFFGAHDVAECVESVLVRQMRRTEIGDDVRS